MEIRQLQYFVTIAHTGGFRTAADALGVSLATLSEQIKSLERELGVRLVERGSRSLSLTVVVPALAALALAITAIVSQAAAQPATGAITGRVVWGSCVRGL